MVMTVSSLALPVLGTSAPGLDKGLLSLGKFGLVYVLFMAQNLVVIMANDMQLKRDPIPQPEYITSKTNFKINIFPWGLQSTFQTLDSQ